MMRQSPLERLDHQEVRQTAEDAGVEWHRLGNEVRALLGEGTELGDRSPDDGDRQVEGLRVELRRAFEWTNHELHREITPKMAGDALRIEARIVEAMGKQAGIEGAGHLIDAFAEWIEKGNGLEVIDRLMKRLPGGQWLVTPYQDHGDVSKPQ